jgi:hypothetical protein
MNARFLPRPARSDNAVKPAPDDMIPSSGPSAMVADRACCCPARPAVRVVMPASPARAHETELLLCGHHFRASREALSAAGAAVYDLVV